MARGEVLAGRCLLPVLIYPPGRPELSVALAGLIDTGAMRSAISDPMAQFVGLMVVGQRRVATPVGNGVSRTYLAGVEILAPGAEGRSWPFPAQQLDGCAAMAGTHLLIGMDVIAQADLRVEAGIWRLRFSRAPSG